MNLKERAKKVKTDIPALFLALKDKDTPIIAKIFAFGTLAYALSPIDLVPDFIPVLGYVDDVIILPFLIALTVEFIPKDVWDRNLEKAKSSNGLLKATESGKWYYIIPAILLIVFLLFVLVMFGFSIYFIFNKYLI